MTCAAVKTRIALTLALLALASPLASPAHAQNNVVQLSQNGGAKRIKLGLNKSIVIDLPRDAYDILVANPDVADAVTRTARRIYLFGKQVGQTNIFVFGPDGEQIASLDLEIERDVAGLNHYLKKYIPGSDITVELINDNVVLTGTVETPQDSARAAKLAELFVSGGEATTGQYSKNVSAGGGGGVSIIDGPDEEDRRTSKIVNLIKTIGDDQVTLKVTVAEVSRSVMKQLGVNMIGSGSADGITYGGISENVAALAGQAITNSGGMISGRFGSGTLSAYLNAMELAGVMKTLAEPTLTAVSGEKAVFKVGGEYNIITGQDVRVNEKTGAENLVTEHEKIEYGIGLEFMPVVLSPGRISLKVRTSVSEPTMEGSIAMSSGGSRPAGNILSLRKRLADTTVELPSGGSMMIAGLIRDETRQAISGMPGLSKIPVLGTLFRSREFVRNETELVILVTPYLVRPMARNALARPDDNLAPASDPAGYILGQVNRVYGTGKAQLPSGRYHGVVGYIYK